MIHPVDYAPSQNFGDNPTSKIRPGSADYWIIEQFGNYQPDGHTGTDYPCPVGTPVRAVADGYVRHVGWMGGTYADNPWWISPPFAGYVAVIDHGSFIGIYGHCLDGSAGVKAGDRVSEGDVFIRSGNTGASTGPHLHFEVLPDGYVLNSYMYGRINPATLFTTISAQSATVTPTTTEEDELSEAAVLDIARIREILEAGEVAGTRASISAIDERTALLVQDIAYVKGSDEPHLYERFPDNTIRPISGTEWELTGKPYVTYPQAKFNEIFKKVA